MFTDCEEDNKIKVEVKKDLEDITEQADKVTVGKSGSTRNVKFLEEAEAGSYTITAFYDSQQLAQQPVTIAEKIIPVTVEINEVEANKEYNVVYSGTVEEQKIKIEVTKDSEDITSSSDVVTIGESGTTRNVKLTETAEAGTYKIIAKYDNEEKKTQEFTKEGE